jgi:large subunit ribosomal protein L18
MVNTLARSSRKRRVRAKINGTAQKPRLSVFRSNTHIYGQLIDDVNGVTLASASDLKSKKGNKTESATAVGKALAELAKKAKITECVFDRNGYKYHGRVKALADGAREGGLQF